MTALIRTVMQVAVSRLLATPFGEALFPLLEQTGVTEERLADYLTVVVLGLGVAAARVLKANRFGAKAVEWANLILSWGRTAAGPGYEPKHLRG